MDSTAYPKELPGKTKHTTKEPQGRPGVCPPTPGVRTTTTDQVKYDYNYKY